MLALNNFNASIEGKEILRNVTLSVGNGEIHVIMGPNGSGKSTLCLGIMGNDGITTDGEIIFDGKNITTLSTEERAKMGMFLFFQHPVPIKGVSVRRLLATIRPDITHDDIIEALKKAGLDESFASRYVNDGFSGGERKKLELAQMIVLRPELAILDEPDSGVDVDSIKNIAGVVNEMRENGTSFLIITHQSRITEYLDVNRFHVLKNGTIVKSGGREIVEMIERYGYEKI